MNVLIIGCGSIGERHLRCMQRTGRAQVGCCEPNAALREKMCQDYDVAHAFASLDEALAHLWDTAVIATPATSHIPIARQLVAADMPVLIEKPLAVTEDGVAELLAEVAQYDVAVGVAYVYRAHPGFAAMREVILSGRFGKVLQVVANCGQHFPTYRPAYARTYYKHHDSGGGAVQDALTHIVNAVQWVVGPTSWVSADMAHCKLAEVAVEDTVHVMARHGDVMTAYTLNQHQAPNECTITFVCEQGTVRFELHQQRWSWMCEPDTPWQMETANIQHRDDWFTAQEQAWLDVVEGRVSPLCTLEEAAHTLRVNRAILESASSGQRLEIPMEMTS